MIPTEEFLVTLKEIDALRFGDFTLASGAQSQFYLDLRYLPAFPDVFSKIITKWAESLKMEFDLIVGIPSAGIPFATALAWVLNKPSQILRKQAKGHGMKRMLEGPSVAGKRVLLVDDLISSGFSKEFAIDALREEGAEVTDIAVLVDRSEGKAEQWSNTKDVTLIPLISLSAAEILSFR